MMKAGGGISALVCLVWLFVAISHLGAATSPAEAKPDSTVFSKIVFGVPQRTSRRNQGRAVVSRNLPRRWRAVGAGGTSNHQGGQGRYARLQGAAWRAGHR